MSAGFFGFARLKEHDEQAIKKGAERLDVFPLPLSFLESSRLWVGVIYTLIVRSLCRSQLRILFRHCLARLGQHHQGQLK